MMAALVGVGLPASASACPQGTRCIAMASGMAELTSIRTHHTETKAAPAPVRYLSLTVQLSVLDEGHASLRSSLLRFEPPVVRTDDAEMPWIWAVLATEVRTHLPRYENDDQFSMVLSPVVVTMPTESTPGIGLSGDF